MLTVAVFIYDRLIILQTPFKKQGQKLELSISSKIVFQTYIFIDLKTTQTICLKTKFKIKV